MDMVLARGSNEIDPVVRLGFTSRRLPIWLLVELEPGRVEGGELVFLEAGKSVKTRVLSSRAVVVVLCAMGDAGSSSILEMAWSVAVRGRTVGYW